MKKLTTLLALFILVSFSPNLSAQDGTDLESAAMAVEMLLDKKGKQSIEDFISKFMDTQQDEAATIQKIEDIREKLKGLRDGIGLDIDEMGAILFLSANGKEERLRIIYDRKSQKVTDLMILAQEEGLEFDINKLDEVIEFMLENDMAGLLHLKSDGKTLIQKPFGMANVKLNVPNKEQTIFAIGSRPIDFTVASILLMDQKGVLSLDDPISKHVANVPNDKTTMTIRHLMTGQSGLPDFFDNDQDWDADLQWIDREEAIKRMLNQKLLFAPGKGRSHSHGAFGLLAAIIELKSGQGYMEYLNEHFFSPAGMNRTGEYGDRKNLEMTDFAEGGGPQFIGIPNIPPNWGPTSWLVKGSGGMYSTLGDLLKFYKYIREGNILDEEHSKHFKGATVNLDGSMRGFELFSAYFPSGSEIYLFLNKPGDRDVRRKLFRALESLID